MSLWGPVCHACMFEMSLLQGYQACKAILMICTVFTIKHRWSCKRWSWVHAMHCLRFDMQLFPGFRMPTSPLQMSQWLEARWLLTRNVMQSYAVYSPTSLNQVHSQKSCVTSQLWEWWELIGEMRMMIAKMIGWNEMTDCWKEMIPAWNDFCAQVPGLPSTDFQSTLALNCSRTQGGRTNRTLGDEGFRCVTNRRCVKWL